MSNIDFNTHLYMTSTSSNVQLLQRLNLPREPNNSNIREQFTKPDTFCPPRNSISVITSADYRETGAKQNHIVV